MSSREGGAEALGLLNLLSHPHPASAGAVHLHSSHTAKAPGRGPRAHAQHVPNPSDQSLCLFPGLPSPYCLSVEMLSPFLSMETEQDQERLCVCAHG